MAAELPVFMSKNSTLSNLPVGSEARVVSVNATNGIARRIMDMGVVPGVTISVRVEIEATAPEGFDDAKVRTVSENAATLKFEESGFEEG